MPNHAFVYYLPEGCSDCKYSNSNCTSCLIYGMTPRTSPGTREQSKDCPHYTRRNINVKLNLEVGEKMKNSKYRVELNSYDSKKDMYLSSIEISCENYETFKKINDAILPILEEEDVKKDCD